MSEIFNNFNFNKYKYELDLNREITFNKLPEFTTLDKFTFISKIENLKNKFVNKNCSNTKININTFLKQLYKKENFETFGNKQKNRALCNKYAKNVDYDLLNTILENDRNKKLTLKKILVKYNQNTKCSKIRITKLWASIKHLNYKYRKLNTINQKVMCKYSINNQKSVIKFVIDRILNNNLIFYIDECPIAKNIKKIKGYIKIGNKINHAIGNERIKRTTLLYIIGENGMFYWKITKNIVNAEKFWTFVNNGMKFFSDKDDFKTNLENRKVYLFMDNAAIHYKRDIRAEYLDLNVKIIYNVAYCCHLNPIEYCFSRLKSFLRSKVIKNQDKLIEIVEEYLEENSEDIICSAMKYTIKIWESLIME